MTQEGRIQNAKMVFFNPESGEFEDVEGKDGRPNVSSQLSDRFVAASELGKAFTWSTRHTSSNDDHIIYLRNTSSTEVLHIVGIEAGSKDQTIFTLNSVTGLGSGAILNEFNMNFSATTSDAVHLENGVGALGTITPFGFRNVSRFGGDAFDLVRALILGENDAITIQTSSGGADTIASITGYFE